MLYCLTTVIKEKRYNTGLLPTLLNSLQHVLRATHLQLSPSPTTPSQDVKISNFAGRVKIHAELAVYSDAHSATCLWVSHTGSTSGFRKQQKLSNKSPKLYADIRNIFGFTLRYKYGCRLCLKPCADCTCYCSLLMVVQDRNMNGTTHKLFNYTT